MGADTAKKPVITWGRIGIAVGALCAILLTGLVAGLLYLDTKSGQQQLVSWITKSFDHEESHLIISPMEGSLFSGFTLPSVIISDQQGPWLELQQVQIDWFPLQLFKRRLALSKMDVATLLIRRWPNSPTGDKKNQTSRGLKIPSLPLDLEIAAFAITKLQLGKTIMGVKAEFTSNGKLKLTRTDGILTEITLVNAGKSKDEITAHIAYPGRGHDFSTDIQIRAPKGGIFTKFAGIDPGQDILASLKGTGPLKDWSGTFVARVGKTTIADAVLHSAGQSLSLHAKLDAGNFIPDTSAALLGRTATLSLDLKPAPDFDRMDLDLSLMAETLSLKANGTIAADDPNPSAPPPSDRVNFLLEVTNPAPFNKLFKPLYFSPVKLNGVLSNMRRNPKIIIKFKNIKTGYGTDIDAQFSGRIEASKQAQTLAFKASGRMDRIKGKVTSDVSALVKPGFDWELQGKSHQENRLTIDLLSLRNDLVTIGSKGQVDWQTGALTAYIKTALHDMASLTPNMAGKMEITADLMQAAAQSPLQAHVAATMDDFDLGADIPNEFIGTSPSFSAVITRTGRGGITIENAKMTARHMSVTAQATVSAEQIIKKSEFSLTVSDLETIKSLKGLAFSGGLDMTGHFSGPLASPSIVLETGLKQLDIQNITLRNAVAQIQADNIFRAAKGTMTIESESNYGALTGKAAFTALRNEIYTIPSLTLSLGQYHAVGAFEAMAGKPVTGQMTILTAASDKSRRPIGGTIEAKIQLSNNGGKQQFSLESSLKDLIINTDHNETMRLQTGEISAKALLETDHPEMTLKATFANLSHPRLQAKAGQLSLGYHKRDLSYDFHILGTNIMPYDLTFSGIMPAAIKGRRKIKLEVNGMIENTVVRLKNPLVINISQGGFSLDPFDLRLGEGGINGRLSMEKNDLTANLTADKADLRPLIMFAPEIPFAGILTGSLRLAATPAATDGSFTFTLCAIGLSHSALTFDQNFKISTEGQLTTQGLAFSGSARLDDTLEAHMSGQLPLHIDVASAKLILPFDQPIRGDIVWKGDIGPIWPAFNLVNHDLSGKVEAKLLVGGTLANPDIDGHLLLKNGRYEILKGGFVAADIDMAATIADRQLTLDHLTANDGADGHISAKAKVKLHADLTYDAQASLDILSAHLIRQPQLDVTASTQLRFLKTPALSSLTGEVTVEQANVGAAADSGPVILDLDVHEINGPENNDQGDKNTGNHFGPIPLDLKVKVPGKLFIRRYGLESEWRSDLVISGTSDKPFVAGSAALIRGIFDFSGKRFNLTRGLLTFPDDHSNDPVLDISAEHKLSDLTAFLNITGRASAPKLTVSSTPNLPQDEILSRILFGTSVTQISAIEALQLAAAIQSLSSGGGPGIIGKIRGALGLDRLSIDQQEGGYFSSIFTGGKYLTNNVYIEVTTAPATGETATSVEVSLTRNLSLVTRQTLSHGKNLALRWSWKY